MISFGGNENGNPERVLLAAFQGWSDAGNAATTSLEHLADLLGLVLIDNLDSNFYVDLQIHRPVTQVDSSGERQIIWPDIILSGPPKFPGKESDPKPAGVRPVNDSKMPEVFTLTGPEPARYWNDFTEDVLDMVFTWEIDYVIFLGSMFSDTPHSRPTPVNVVSRSQALRKRFDGQEPDYEGPIGISNVIANSLDISGIDSASIWAQVPHYVHSSPSPKATLALLDKLEEVLNVVIPRGDLLDEATEWERNIDSLASQDEDMINYISRLEDARDSFESPQATGEAIAYELEKFLHQNPTLETDGEKQDPPHSGPGSDSENENGA